MSKYILITASSKGLGLEIAKQLSFVGYNIILTSRNKENLKRFATPKDIAPYVVDIIEQKSMMITGSIIKLDTNEY
jgi:short-subunit dehydrogenase